MKKPIKSKYPELLEIRNRHYQATEELKEAFKRYNQARKFVEKYNTEENYLQLAEANYNWTIKTEEYDLIKIKVNEFKNPIHYGKLNTLEETH
jgi:spore coat protein CotH